MAAETPAAAACCYRSVEAVNKLERSVGRGIVCTQLEDLKDWLSQ